MRYQPHKFAFLSLLLALIYWFGDSSIHYFLYQEDLYEFLPNDSNELWMRLTIVSLMLVFGVYVDISMGQLQRAHREREEMQREHDRILTRLLSGYVSICAVCKKVKVDDHNLSQRGRWQAIESYISSRTDLQFSHGYCDECGKIAKQGFDSESE